MTNPTDANGRQRTPTDAPRPLREAVAEAMFESTVLGRPYSWFVAPSTQKTRAIALDSSDLRRMTDAAIAAMVDALLSDEAVEAGAAVLYEIDMSGSPRVKQGEWESTPSWVQDSYRMRARGGLEAALRRMGAVEGE